MRRVGAVFLVCILVHSVAPACTRVSVFEPECEKDPAMCARRDLRELYDRSDVVYEVTIQAVSRPQRGQSLNTVRIDHAWKVDGRPNTVVEAGWGGGDCSIAFGVGETYVLFLRRDPRSGGLYAGLGNTFEPSRFPNMSPYHAEFYAARTRESLRALLGKLDK